MYKHLSVVGVDLAKQVFHMVGMDDKGKIIFRKRLSRNALMPFMVKLPPVLIGMEACGGSHYWARRFRDQGHDVKLMAPQFVKPYVKSHKNDTRDAEAICEAVTRPTMRFVPIKTIEQQDVQALHRVRERLMKARTALINEMRGLLHEYGIVLPKGASKFRKTFAIKIDAEQDKLSALSREMFEKLYDELVTLEEQLSYYQGKLEALAAAHPESRRLMTIPGIGPLTSTALVAAVGDASAFKNGRQCSAWLGLVPRQHSTGGKERLLGISKRGDVYLRKLLVHGGRAVVREVDKKTDRYSQWIRALVERRGANRAAVAVANKNARMAWALLSRQQDYQPATG